MLREVDDKKMKKKALKALKRITFSGFYTNCIAIMHFIYMVVTVKI